MLGLLMGSLVGLRGLLVEPLCCVSVIVITEPEIALETALSGVRRRLKKTNAWAFDPAS